MRRTAKATLVGAGGVAIIATVHETSLLAFVAGVLLVLGGGLLCLVWAVVFAENDGPTSRFERVTAALAQLAPRKGITQPRTDTAATPPPDGSQEGGLGPRPRR